MGTRGRRVLRPLLHGFLAVALLTSAAPAREEPQERKTQEGRAAGRMESERDARIRKARQEIRRNPSQKKFILFRFGLTEDDLR